MDPITAVGLVANIVQFVELGSKVLGIAKEIHQSSSGVTQDNKRTEDIVREMEGLSSKLADPAVQPKTEDERALQFLASECCRLSEQITTLLKKIIPTDPKSKRQAVLSSMKNVMYEREKAALEEKLAHCRSQLSLQLSYISRSVMI